MVIQNSDLNAGDNCGLEGLGVLEASFNPQVFRTSSPRCRQTCYSVLAVEHPDHQEECLRLALVKSRPESSQHGTVIPRCPPNGAFGEGLV
eukprot:3966736-Amphidinium_carterae.1